jgi:hypothetical protein
MKFDVSKIELEDWEFGILHDLILEALGKKIENNEEILEYWNRIPDYLKLDVIKWGMDDTPTRDNIYKWFRREL